MSKTGHSNIGHLSSEDVVCSVQKLLQTWLGESLRAWGWHRVGPCFVFSDVRTGCIDALETVAIAGSFRALPWGQLACGRCG